MATSKPRAVSIPGDVTPAVVEPVATLIDTSMAAAVEELEPAVDSQPNAADEINEEVQALREMVAKQNAELVQLKAQAAKQQQVTPIKTMTGGVQQTDKGWVVPAEFGAPPSIKRA